MRILPVELKEEISVPFEALALPPLPIFVLQVDGPAGGGREERHPEHHLPAQAGHASPGTCQVRERFLLPHTVPLMGVPLLCYLLLSAKRRRRKVAHLPWLPSMAKVTDVHGLKWGGGEGKPFRASHSHWGGGCNLGLIGGRVSLGTSASFGG